MATVLAKNKIEVLKGDITRQKVDAIVNAANSSLLGGGGVDGAIHRAAGKELLEECRELGGCPAGEARLTGGYNLAAEYVIHTVGPVWHGGGRNEDLLLSQCYRNCFFLAGEKGMKTLAFPAISTGVYRFPIRRATTIALDETFRALKSNNQIEKVSFVCFGNEVYNAYLSILGDA
ncbi:O-acetyl-ADP-ribose deacetylase [Fibrobacterota bacterium]